jgi:hypothetical protein
LLMSSSSVRPFILSRHWSSRRPRLLAAPPTTQLSPSASDSSSASLREEDEDEDEEEGRTGWREVRTRARADRPTDVDVDSGGRPLPLPRETNRATARRWTATSPFERDARSERAHEDVVVRVALDPRRRRRDARRRHVSRAPGPRRWARAW